MTRVNYNINRKRIIYNDDLTSIYQALNLMRIITAHPDVYITVWKDDRDPTDMENIADYYYLGDHLFAHVSDVIAQPETKS